MAKQVPHDAEQALLAQQFAWLAKMGPLQVRDRDVSYWLGRALPFLMEEVSVQHRLQAEFVQDL